MNSSVVTIPDQAPLGSPQPADDRIHQNNRLAGTKGQMQSMYLFMDERGLKKGIRIPMENPARYNRVLTVPVYAVSHLFRQG